MKDKNGTEIKIGMNLIFDDTFYCVPLILSPGTKRQSMIIQDQVHHAVSLKGDPSRWVEVVDLAEVPDVE